MTFSPYVYEWPDATTAYILGDTTANVYILFDSLIPAQHQTGFAISAVRDLVVFKPSQATLDQYSNFGKCISSMLNMRLPISIHPAAVEAFVLGSTAVDIKVDTNDILSGPIERVYVGDVRLDINGDISHDAQNNWFYVSSEYLVTPVDLPDYADVSVMGNGKVFRRSGDTIAVNDSTSRAFVGVYSISNNAIEVAGTISVIDLVIMNDMI